MSNHRGGGRWRVVALVLVAIASPVFAQDSVVDSPPNASIPTQAPEADALQVPSGGRPLVLSRLDAIPRQLKAALHNTSCMFVETLLSSYPVLIFRPADGRHLMAVVPCRGIVIDSRAFEFERSIDSAPTPMTFPVAGPTGGFNASSQPGLMNWDAQTATLTAWRGSDVCPAREIRHTYRQAGGELNGFALSKIEHRPLRCAGPQAEWQTLWQWSAWNLLR